MSSGPWTEEEYFEQKIGFIEPKLYGDPFAHAEDCDKLIRLKASGIGCDCGARWFCV